MKNEYDIAIIGGGISGLYCCWKLQSKFNNKRIGLFEASDRWGGRIETIQLGPFKAEFGPMRFEQPIGYNEDNPILGGQVEFLKMIKALNLKTSKFQGYDTEKVNLSIYDLKNDETKCKDATDLMKLGIFKILKDYLITKEIIKNEDYDPIKNNDWLGKLSEEVYSDMRKNAEFNGIRLYNRGFWNALSLVISYEAIKSIKDNGNFYHLIPENPNAIEWIIFWLRGYNPKDELVYIEEGSEEIIRRLLKEIDTKSLNPEHKLVSVKRSNENESDVLLDFEGRETITAKHVILAIPQKPLEKIIHCFNSTVQDDINAVFGFSLLKCFILVKYPWWNNKTKVHTRASHIPTRELHYQQEGEDGLMLLYTDKPASQFWKVYVQDKYHDRAEIYNGEGERIDKEGSILEGKRKDKELILQFRNFMAEADKDLFIEHIKTLITVDKTLGEKVFNDEGFRELKKFYKYFSRQAIIKYGIRDWEREPYGAACHTWKPQAKSWEVLDRLKAFSLDTTSGNKNIHICGEAYSDYNGFIEGSLRSSNSVLETITDC